ncbi:dual specificity protein phosphatase 22-B isoform X2 [Gambusia affinis]|uniref:dual specificity protein phosphatase 22-B isoform X2 n=1 Tax=Gambusia affinis TaxID=33528 RepID=UPI001CDC1109|nr:dual specificity protein phosphatase 22-B isoform X2 [Gambusia affinis]
MVACVYSFHCTTCDVPLIIAVMTYNKYYLHILSPFRTQHFKESIMFMHECRLKGEGCLVHCLAGVSRSVTLVIAYIMTMTGLGWQDVLNAVRVVRPCANPNLGFQKQLQEFEDTKAKEFREWFQMKYENNPFNDTADILKLLGRVPDVNNEGMENHVSTPPEGI